MQALILRGLLTKDDLEVGCLKMMDDIQAAASCRSWTFSPFFLFSVCNLQAVRENVVMQPDLPTAVRDADIVIESVPESIEMKRTVFTRRLERPVFFIVGRSLSQQTRPFLPSCLCPRNLPTLQATNHPRQQYHEPVHL